LFWAIILLFFCIFFIGVFMKSMIGDHETEFRTVPNSMFTIFRCYTDGCPAYDGTPLSERLFAHYGGVFFLGYILSFMFVTVGIFNLIMAIFIDNVLSSSMQRKLEELGAKSRAVEAHLKRFLVGVVSKINRDANPDAPQATWAMLVDEDMSMTKEDFELLLDIPEMHYMLEEMDIETSTKSDLFDVLDVDMGGELGMDELVDGLMTLRGPITKTDIVAVRLKVRYVTKMVEDMWRRGAGDDARGLNSSGTGPVVQKTDSSASIGDELPPARRDTDAGVAAVVSKRQSELHIAVHHSEHHHHEDHPAHLGQIHISPFAHHDD